jgi:hypothetical protein
MADRKVYVNVTTRLIIRADEGVDIGDIISELQYNFFDTTGKADVEDTEIINHEVTDSK